MDFRITTTQLDATVAVKACGLYKEGRFRDAIPVLQDILDMEPRNWQAKLYLGACYYQTGQLAASQRAFRAVYTTCDDNELKQKACMALQAVTAEMEGRSCSTPAEFSGMAERLRKPLVEIESLMR